MSSNTDDFYLIAEIGHNHQGDIKKAFELFKEAKAAGACSKVAKEKIKNYTQRIYNELRYRNSYGKPMENTETLYLVVRV